MRVQPKFIAQMIKKQQEKDYDVVTGTRYVQGGGVWGWDLRRKLTRQSTFFIFIFIFVFVFFFFFASSSLR